MKDYYKILNIKRTASQEEIKKAYHKLAKKFHPDLNKDSNTTEIFQEINEAYQTLYDEKNRTLYNFLYDLNSENTNKEFQEGNLSADADLEKNDDEIHNNSEPKEDDWWKEDQDFKTFCDNLKKQTQNNPYPLNPKNKRAKLILIIYLITVFGAGLLFIIIYLSLN